MSIPDNSQPPSISSKALRTPSSVAGENSDLVTTGKRISRPESWVWKHFTRIITGDAGVPPTKCTCNYCKKQFSCITKNSTKLLQKHFHSCPRIMEHAIFLHYRYLVAILHACIFLARLMEQATPYAYTIEDRPLLGPHYPGPLENAGSIPVNVPSLTENEKWRWINGVRKKINEEARLHHTRSGPPSIFLVPEHIKQSGGDLSGGRLFDKAYRPLVVHIGPYHWDLSFQPRFATVQTYKWQSVRAILSRHQDQVHASKQLNLCLEWLIEPKVQAAVRECYSEELGFEAGKLAQLLLVDACFIIHMLLENAIAKKENMAEDEATVVGNQLWDCLRPAKQKMKEEGETSNAMGTTSENDGDILSLQHKRSPFLIEVDRQETCSTEENMVSIDIKEEDRKIQAPLVEGLWTWNLAVYDLLKLENQIPFFVIQCLYDNLKTSDDGDDLSSLVLKLFSHIRPKKADKLTIHGTEKIHHLLHLFHASLVHEISRSSWHHKKAPERIPSATELKRAWITIKRKEEASSFLDITFKNTFFGGVIEIPKLQVYDCADSIFRNLIAFEQCYPHFKPHGAYITLYCVLMDCIIDTAEDVRLLESEGILETGLCNEDAVADLLNKFCKDIHYKIDGSYLGDLFAKVNNAYESRWRKLYASLKRNYFANPWAFISFGAATALLLLTVEQAVFAAFSYYHH